MLCRVGRTFGSYIRMSFESSGQGTNCDCFPKFRCHGMEFIRTTTSKKGRWHPFVLFSVPFANGRRLVIFLTSFTDSFNYVPHWYCFITPTPPSSHTFNYSHSSYSRFHIYYLLFIVSYRIVSHCPFSYTDIHLFSLTSALLCSVYECPFGTCALSSTPTFGPRRGKKTLAILASVSCIIFLLLWQGGFLSYLI